MAELAAACKKHGIRLGAYYSACAWHHPAFPLGSPRGSKKKPNPDLKAYDKYLRAQTEELITNYGPLLTIWFDVPQSYSAKYGNPMVKKLRELQPDILINNRAYSDGRKVNFSHQTSLGDYSTPEQRIGGFDRDRPWETCMTICHQWAWKPNDNMKSLKQCIQTLLQTIGGDGNLLFNVGPMPDGRIEPRQVERLKEMGEWLDKYDKAVYKTRGGPFMPGKWGASTCRGKKIYLFVMNWQSDGNLYLPAIDAKIKKAKALSGGKVKFTQDAEGITISLPKEKRDEIATVIELKVNRDAFEIKPVKVMHKSNSVAFGKKVTASNTFKKQASQYGPAMATDDNPDTRWATDAGIKQAWLEVDLGKPTKISKVYIDEREWNRIKKFELQYKTDGDWKTILAGTTIGKDFSKEFKPVTAQNVRLNIPDAANGPTIWEFKISE
jgi:alpha-L-fucosidase